MKNMVMSLIVFGLFSFFPLQAKSYYFVYEYDNQDRLIHVLIGAAAQINYTYDAVGNRLSMVSAGLPYAAPAISDDGSYTLDNTLLDVHVDRLGDEFGNLTYEFTIGTQAHGNDVFDWTSLAVAPDGTLQIDGLSLPWGQQYFIGVRVRNFAGAVVTDTGATDGIYVLDPAADHDEDGASNLAEHLAGTDPFNLDTDGDGMLDGWELLYDLNPLVDDAFLDKDGDGFCNLREFIGGSNPDDITSVPPSMTIYVDGASQTGVQVGTPEDPFTTIGQAIAFAGPGDTLYVAAGTYAENLVVDKTLALIGEDRQTTIIDGGGAMLPAVQFSAVTAGSIEGFWVRNGTGAGIHCEQSVLTIADNIVSHVVAQNGQGDGIWVGDNAAATIRHNIIYTNDVNGIFIAETGAAAIVNNTIVDNGTSGIASMADAAVSIRNNIIVQNGLYGITCEGAGAPVIAYNDVWSNYIADYLNCEPGEGNIGQDPLFVSADAADYRLTVCSPAIDAGDPASDYSLEPLPNGGRINMGAFGGTMDAATSVAGSADLDNDGDVDGFDLYLFLQQFGNMDCAGCPQDLNMDGVVDQDDLEAFLCRFGR